MALARLLKFVDQRSKDTVNGYLRELQNMVDRDYSTPPQVEYCCLAYYLREEYFTKCGDAMRINEEKDTATNTDSVMQTVYGNILIDLKNDKILEYKWEIELLECQGQYAYIGLDSSDKQCLNTNFAIPVENKHVFYGFATDGFFAWQQDYGKGSSGIFGEMNFCDSKKETITMVLNVKDASLRYHRNGEDLGVVVPSIRLDLKYHFAVMIRTNGQSVKLVKFQTR